MIQVNKTAKENLFARIRAGDVNKTDGWKWTVEDENSLLGEEQNWEEYSKWHLAIDTDANEETKQRYKFPFGKNGKVYRSAVIAIKQRAAQHEYDNIYKVADEALRLIDEEKDETVITIYGGVGADILSEGDNIVREIQKQIENAEGDIVVRINSPGGSVFDGFTIYNLLKQYSNGKVKVVIDGLAASIASVIAMAGDEIEIYKNGMIMIHRASGVVVGNADDADKMREILNKLDLSIAKIYSERTGLSEKEVLEMMDKETWLTAEEAVNLKFVDRVIKDEKVNSIEMAKSFAALWQGKSMPMVTTMTGCNSTQSTEKLPSYYCTITTNNFKKEGGKKMINEVNEILAIAQKHGELELAAKFIKEGKSKDEFVEALLEKKGAVKTAPVNIDLPKSEAKRYSYGKAILEAMKGGLTGLEKEINDYFADKIFKKPARGVYLPMRLMNAAQGLNVGAGADGGYTVPTELNAREFIDYFRARLVLEQAGARLITGLSGNLAIPKATAGATGYWVGEAGSVTASKETFGQVSLTPKTAAAKVPFTRELLIQSAMNPSIEEYVKKDIAETLAILFEKAALVGSGSSNQPQGIAATTGVNTVTFGGSATWAKIVEFETQVGLDNCPLPYDKSGFIVTAATRGKWKGIKQDNYVSSFLWQNVPGQDYGEVNGYKAYVPGHDLTYGGQSNRVFFGNWDYLILAIWGDAVELIVDPYTALDTNEVIAYGHLYCDVGIRQVSAFCVSTDSGAQ